LNSQKKAKALHQKKYRFLNNEFIIEGRRSIRSAIEANAEITLLFYTTDFSKNNPDIMESS